MATINSVSFNHSTVYGKFCKAGLVTPMLNEDTVRISIWFYTKEQANNFFSLLPKSLKAKIGKGTGLNDFDVKKYETYYIVSVETTPTKTRLGDTNKVTGIVNESGPKRIKKIYDVLIEYLNTEIND